MNANTPTTPAENSEVAKQATVIAQYEGPIPPASELAKYEAALPGAADRILRMAESETAQRHRLEDLTLQAEYRAVTHAFIERMVGQIFGLIIALTTIIAGTYAAVHGAEIAGGLIGTSGVAGLVAVFVRGRKRDH